MKLKVKVDRVSLLRDVLNTILMVRKEAYVIFTQQEIRIVSPVSNDGTTISLWVQFSVPYLCDENQYICVSIFNDMCIVLLSLEDFARALKSASSYHMDEVRLSLRQYQGLLQMQVKVTQQRKMGITSVSHNLTVDPRKPDDVNYLLEQPQVHPDVYIMMPKPALNVSKLSERYRRLGKVVTVSANKEGCLTLTLNAFEVNVETEWKGLMNPKLEAGLNDDNTNVTNDNISNNHDYPASQTTLHSSQVRFSSQYHERAAPGSPDYFAVSISCKDWCLLTNMGLICESVVLAISHEKVLTAYCFTDHIGDSNGYATYYMPHIEE